MKKFTKLNLVVATLLTAGALATPAAAFADDNATSPAVAGVDNQQGAGNKNLTGKAKITFTGDTTKGLTLDHVPNFDFQTRTLTSNMNSQYTADGEYIQVTDLTGSSNGYIVSAKADQLAYENDNGIKLPMATSNGFLFTTTDGKADDSTHGQITGNGAVNIYGNDAVTVASGNKNANGTNKSGKTTAQLNLNNNTIKAGTYSGNIDYTLASGPTANN